MKHMRLKELLGKVSNKANKQQNLYLKKKKLRKFGFDDIDEFLELEVKGHG